MKKNNRKPQILLTNDDGIESPGLWAAASSLSEFGFVHVAAPREQSSGSGRSLSSSSDGVIDVREVTIDGKTWKVHAVGGTPSLTVMYALLEILPEFPDLIVSGINFGENIGSGITTSGTVGAALEGADMGVRSLAVSLETRREHHYSLSSEVDFSAAAHFTALFSRMLLSGALPSDVDILKVDVPSDATVETPWEITRLSRIRYFQPVAPERDSWSTPARMGYRHAYDNSQDEKDTDAYALCVRRVVSVTPLSLDLTSRLDLRDFEAALRGTVDRF